MQHKNLMSTTISLAVMFEIDQVQTLLTVCLFCAEEACCISQDFGVLTG